MKTEKEGDRLYHVVVINKPTKQKDFVTVEPVGHAEGCAIMSEVSCPRHQCRKQLEPVKKPRNA
jgi:hypothetical protein